MEKSKLAIHPPITVATRESENDSRSSTLYTISKLALHEETVQSNEEANRTKSPLDRSAVA